MGVPRGGTGRIGVPRFAGFLGLGTSGFPIAPDPYLLAISEEIDRSRPLGIIIVYLSSIVIL